MNNIILFLEKYLFAVIVLYCFGFFYPDISSKLSMMDYNVAEANESLSGSNITKQLFWIFCFLFSVFVGIKRGFLDKKFVFSISILIFIATILGFISSVWSLYPILTIKRSIFQLIFVTSVYMSVRMSHSKGKLTTCLISASILVILLIILTIVLGTAFTSEGNLAGFLAGKNLLGQNILVLLCLMMIVKMVFSQKKSYLTWICIYALLLFLLLTISKTCLALLLLYILIFKLNKTLLSGLLFFLFWSFFGVFVLLPGGSYLLGDYSHIGLYIDPSAITGRGFIWSTLYYDMFYFDHILVGYGYGAYFGNGTIPYFFDDDWSFLKHIASSHNGYLDIFLQYGLIISTLIFYLTYKLVKGVKDSCILAAFFIPVIYNVIESAYLRDQTMMWMFTIVIICLKDIRGEYKNNTPIS